MLIIVGFFRIRRSLLWFDSLIDSATENVEIFGIVENQPNASATLNVTATLNATATWKDHGGPELVRRASESSRRPSLARTNLSQLQSRRSHFAVELQRAVSEHFCKLLQPVFVAGIPR